MTITMRPRAECDECGEQFTGIQGENSFDLRARLRQQGWSTPDSENSYGLRDLCSSCTAARRFLKT